MKIKYALSGVFGKEILSMDKKKLGKKIKLARVENDLSQVQLAELIEARQKSISGYETGATAPSIEILLKIAKILKKPISYFLEE